MQQQSRRFLASSTVEDLAVGGDSEETRRKRAYLATMLGKDMAGERYLTRLVTAATAQQQQLQQKVESVIQLPATPPFAIASTASTINGAGSLTSQSFSVPVLSIKWGSSMETIKADLDTALKAAPPTTECFLDFAGVAASTASQVAHIKKHLPNSVKIVAAVNCMDLSACDVASSAGFSVVNLRSRGAGAVGNAASDVSKNVKTGTKSQPTSIVKPAMLHQGAVRSGQQLYAEGSSLIVIGSVNDGAEVLADGDIHVYGALKGRAVAGLGGSTDARVFAHYFSPSLVGVSDSFAMPDDCPALRSVSGKAVSVRLAKNSGDSPSSSSDSNNAIEVDCGNGNKLVVSVLPLREV